MKNNALRNLGFYHNLSQRYSTSAKKLLRTIAVTATLSLANAQAIALSLFQDDFDKISTVAELFKTDGSQWTSATLTSTANDIKLQSYLSGKILRFSAVPLASEVSKTSLHRKGLDLREGQRVSISASFYIPSGVSLNEVFLLDLECESCWPDNSPYPNQSPGVRLALKGSNGVVTIDRGKIGYQERLLPFKNVAVPRDRWFQLEWLMTLSSSTNGLTEVYLNNDRILEAYGINLPNVSYLEQKAKISLKLPVKYDRLEVGITANSSGAPQTVYVDNVKLTTW